MSNDTTQLPADVRERVAKIVREAMEDARRSERLNTFPQSSMWDYADRILALLRTPRGEGEAMDADEIWNHWTSGHEDAALQGLRTATDDEAHRFLGMVADWQRCPKPSDHDAIAALRSEASGQGGIHPDPETWRCRQCGGYAAHYRDCPALRSEAPGEERASKYGALLAFADAISDAVWGGERAWEQDGGLERLSQTVRRWAKE